MFFCVYFYLKFQIFWKDGAIAIRVLPVPFGDRLQESAMENR